MFIYLKKYKYMYNSIIHIKVLRTPQYTHIDLILSG